MNGRGELLASIANTIRDYRAGDLPEPVPDHVDRWIRQFGTDVQLPMLREMDHVLRRTYFSRNRVHEFFTSVMGNRQLADKEPREFWRNVHLLDIQQNGTSQTEIRELFETELEQRYGLNTGEGHEGSSVFVYLDDVLFTGSRVESDLADWIASDAPATAIVHVVVIAAHCLGEWNSRTRIEAHAATVGKNLRVHCWAAEWIENRLACRDRSEVLWPVEIPRNVAAENYLIQGFQPRNPGGTPRWDVFSSEEGRQLLERELLSAGMRIRSFSQKPDPTLRPLGFGPFNVGFGSMIVTHRNCPNNAPLALWWGDPTQHANHPLSRWYPLVQRRPYDN